MKEISKPWRPPKSVNYRLSGGYHFADTTKFLDSLMLEGSQKLRQGQNPNSRGES